MNRGDETAHSLPLPSPHPPASNAGSGSTCSQSLALGSGGEGEEVGFFFSFFFEGGEEMMVVDWASGLLHLSPLQSTVTAGSP